jgi:hypothetical protein
MPAARNVPRSKPRREAEFELWGSDRVPGEKAAYTGTRVDVSRKHNLQVGATIRE